ncbi:methyltransferase [Terrihabitans soli]|uniref:Methyltransferase n=1 Tax=Terrihabitans soli TaxID=708113 RepID=A0A6S6QR28_9HYPH|nr:methyltransferase domain-containing protein [Terrihabitans soli]BCJ89722.1 methyltransferase [Terrihabitans soli]
MSAPRLFDTALRRSRLERARNLGLSDEFLMPRIAEEMAERLAPVLRDFPNAVDLFSRGTDIRDALKSVDRIGSLKRAGDEPGADITVQGEALPFAPASLDLVVSALALHWAEDLPGLLVQIRRALRPDGLFMAAVAGGETLNELRRAFAEAESETLGGLSPRVIPFADVRDLGALLQRAGFALPVVDSERLTIRYKDIYGLFRDLRSLGATNPMLARAKTPLRRQTLAKLDEIYRAHFSDPDGRIRATVEIVWMSGWAPHESQQKPLRPGSAKARLADALGTVEIPSGVKPPRSST